MTDRVRLRATAVLAAILSLPTVRALLAYDIGAVTAALRILLAIAVAIAAVAVVGSLLGRVPPPGGRPADEETPASPGAANEPIARPEPEHEPAGDEPE